MMMRIALRVALLALAFALATVVFGWGGVALAAIAWGWLARHARWPGAFAAGGAAAAWAALLVWSASRGEVGALANLLGDVMQVPRAALIVLTILFATAIAWAGARAASGVAQIVQGQARAP